MAYKVELPRRPYGLGRSAEQRNARYSSSTEHENGEGTKGISRKSTAVSEPQAAIGNSTKSRYH